MTAFGDQLQEPLFIAKSIGARLTLRQVHLDPFGLLRGQLAIEIRVAKTPYFRTILHTYKNRLVGAFIPPLAVFSKSAAAIELTG
jgi:hypothetical protein